MTAGGAHPPNFSGTLTVISSTFSENSASPAFGGAIYIGSGSLTVANSTFSSGNSGVSGGAIYITDGTLTVTDSTFSGNNSTGGYGGAIFIYNGSATTVTNSTFSGNSAPSGYGGGIDNYSGTLTVTDSILASDGVGGECVGTGCPTNGADGNIVNPTGTAANLAALGNYGGPTQTMIPLPGSSAICAGAAASAASAGVTADQRGVILNLTTGNASAYTGAGGYCPAGSLDAGAVQTDYAISFTTDPPSMGTVPGTAMSPAPVVTLTESGTPFAGGSASMSVTDTAVDLSGGSTLTASTSTATATAGQAAFSNLIFNGATTGDMLSATLSLNPSLTTPLSLMAQSTGFKVGAAQTSTVAGNATANFSNVSQNVTLSATVSSGAGTVNVGAVTFTVLNSSNVAIGSGSGTVTGGSVSAAVTLPAKTPAGAYKIDAEYSGGSPTFANSGDTTHTLTIKAVPIASISPSTGINFGTSIYLGSVITKTVTLTNVGDAAMTISNPLIAIVKGGNSNEFVTVNLCPKSLAAGKSCTMTVTFFAGPYYTAQTADLMISDSAAGSPQIVPLSATVINPLAKFSATSLSFGTEKTNSGSSKKSITVTSAGGTSLSISKIAVSGADPKDFTETNNCIGTFNPKATCSISVTFKPTAKGGRTASLVVTDNAQNSPQSIPLSGTGN